MKTMIQLSMVIGEDLNDAGMLQEMTSPVALDIDQIRDFYPRKRGKSGTRILFRSSSALAVTELYPIVRGLLQNGACVFLTPEGFVDEVAQPRTEPTTGGGLATPVRGVDSGQDDTGGSVENEELEHDRPN